MNKLVRDIAEKEFTDLKERNVFIAFMEERFPDEKFEGYIMEWVGRFRSGQPEVFMDNLSKRVYNNLVPTLQDRIIDLVIDNCTVEGIPDHVDMANVCIVPGQKLKGELGLLLNR